LKSSHTEFGQGYYIGARARFALRYFVRLLRTHPVYAVGYVIVAVMTIRPAERQKTRVSGAIRFQSGTSS
jgi:hypothetical protein